ncbi:unnamed protein product [Soboliphyme baturini]|uniref:Homeobox domain-containing protein n=1 Tax=Soboliphyme baturini TaxID=241478 RepID=A0A183IYC1_9BILA|nr:unnamed protein product [Soboliphyme baturini]
MSSDAEEQLNRYMAVKVGLTPAQVKFLRNEFKKYGRNPLPSSLEIIAIENGFDENKVKVSKHLSTPLQSTCQ